MEADLSKFDYTILSGQFGVRLVRRGEDDPHVCIQVLSEDDGNWLCSENSFSSFWLSDLQGVLRDAERWMKKNCKKSADGYGYDFKE